MVVRVVTVKTAEIEFMAASLHKLSVVALSNRNYTRGH